MRFDVFETVHLPNDVGGIEKVEGIGLTTMISAEAKGEKIRLFGVLLLSGSYIDLDGDREQIEHTIPVEIMIPKDRVKRIEDLATTFENSNVNILSSRTIRITGVLRLSGVEQIVLRDSAIVPTESPSVAAAETGIGGSYE